MKSPITTHVLDLASGRPAAGVAVILEREDGRGRWIEVGVSATDEDGRVRNLVTDVSKLETGVYRIVFNVDAYFLAQGRKTFYREVPVVFTVHDADEHYHVPLLLSPFGYSTYRGS